MHAAFGARWLAGAATAMTLASLSLACSKPETSAAPADSGRQLPLCQGPGCANAEASAAAVVLPRASGSANANAAPGAPNAPVRWAGTYEATEGTLHVPEGKEYAGVKFRGEKSELGLGKGELKLEVDPRGTAVGTLEGPLGPAVVSGSVHDGVLSARIDPKTPSSEGFVGTLLGKTSAASCEGTMNLSQGEARIIREAKFTLKRAP